MNRNSAVCVLAPTLLYTVTVEAQADGTPDVHFHAGGQAFWVARMACLLGAETTVCAPIGGESGLIIRTLVEASGMTLRALPVGGWNGGYVHDRRSGERVAIADVPAPVLQRHEADDLVDLALATAPAHGAIVLTAPSNPDAIPASIYATLARNATALGCRVVADLSGTHLQALEGGVDVLKISHSEVIEAGFADDDSVPQLTRAADHLRDRGNRIVILSRASEPALAVTDVGRWLVHVPELEAVEYRGAGDSMTGAVAVALANGLATPDLLRYCAAAGAMNVTRRGLGSGNRELVEVLADQVRLEAMPTK